MLLLLFVASASCKSAIPVFIVTYGSFLFAIPYSDSRLFKCVSSLKRFIYRLPTKQFQIQTLIATSIDGRAQFKRMLFVLSSVEWNDLKTFFLLNWSARSFPSNGNLHTSCVVLKFQAVCLSSVPWLKKVWRSRVSEINSLIRIFNTGFAYSIDYTNCINILKPTNAFYFAEKSKFAFIIRWKHYHFGCYSNNSVGFTCYSFQIVSTRSSKGWLKRRKRKRNVSELWVTWSVACNMLCVLGIFVNEIKSTAFQWRYVGGFSYEWEKCCLISSPI